MLDNGHVTAENYYVRMEGISVGETRLNIPKGIFEISAEGDGGVIIDTGTAYSHLIMMAHDPLIIELEEQIKLEKAPFDPDGSYPLCYKTNNKSDIITSMPYITFHFSGMDLILQKWNTWEDDGDGSVCLTLIQANDEVTVIGAQQLQNVNVGYDLKNKVISLQSKDCTKT
ncbi:hypothetical protein MKX01_035348 [Papaver californicum]|nr:hypothetical protein MKX01_035348 [Papaver californicum]